MLCGPMHLRACVREERGDGEGEGSQALSDTLRYINLAGRAIAIISESAFIFSRIKKGEVGGKKNVTLNSKLFFFILFSKFRDANSGCPPCGSSVSTDF